LLPAEPLLQRGINLGLPEAKSHEGTLLSPASCHAPLKQ
jgi:hypothetical protein